MMQGSDLSSPSVWIEPGSTRGNFVRGTAAEVRRNAVRYDMAKAVFNVVAKSDALFPGQTSFHGVAVPLLSFTNIEQSSVYVRTEA